MIFYAKYLIELPYILNLEDGDYEFRYENAVIRTNINNNLYALVSFSNKIQLTRAIGTKEQLIPLLSDSFSLIKAKTIVCFISVIEPSELEIISQDELIDAMRTLIHSGESYPTKEEGKKRFLELNEDQLRELKDHEVKLKTARKYFPASKAPECVALINHFVRRYSVYFKDHFAEEVSLNHLTSGLTNGVMIQLFCGSEMISSMPTVGLFPYLLRGTLFTHDEDKTKNFRDALLKQDPNLQSALLLIRAKSLKTKGAYRSATIEAAAGIENYIRLNLIKKMRMNGLTDKDIELSLANNHLFEVRCKKVFKELYLKSVPEIAPLEWQEVKKDRDTIRHKTAHTAHEPTEKEVDTMISNIESLIEKLEPITSQN